MTGLEKRMPKWEYGTLIGKTRSFDHPSPEYDKLIKHQITRSFALSTRIGPK